MTRFSITPEWIGREFGTKFERYTLAEITITVNGSIVTEVEDMYARSIRRSVRVSAYSLAYWLLYNLWRIEWEPYRGDFSWQMSHRMSAIGEGYIWPNLVMIGDGDRILFRAEPIYSHSDQPIRYINRIDTSISITDFKVGIKRFVETVIARMESIGVDNYQLRTLWHEINEEQINPEIASWRKLEAIMGFDPDEVPDDIINELQQNGQIYGDGFVEEMAAEFREDAVDLINRHLEIDQYEKSVVHIPKYAALKLYFMSKLNKNELSLPWQYASDLAKLARNYWGLENKPVSNQMIEELFGISKSVIEKGKSYNLKYLNTGFRNGIVDQFEVFLKSPYEENRRFALLRLVGDHLFAPSSDKILPVGNSRTKRQQFQRAFSQEVLCPYKLLKDFLGLDDTKDVLPEDEAIEEAAYYFNVSARLVDTVLANKDPIVGNYFYEKLRYETIRYY